MAYRELSAQPIAAADFDEFLGGLHRALIEERRDPNEIVRDTLQQIYFGATPCLSNLAELSPPARAVVHTFDPRNVTTEPEYYPEIHVKLYAERKPLIWLWQMFDRSLLGQNAILGPLSQNAGTADFQAGR